MRGSVWHSLRGRTPAFRAPDANSNPQGRSNERPFLFLKQQQSPAARIAPDPEGGAPFGISLSTHPHFPSGANDSKSHPTCRAGSGAIRTGDQKNNSLSIVESLLVNLYFAKKMKRA